MNIRENPFGFLKASDYSDMLINEFWVSSGEDIMLKDVLDPLGVTSKYILGGKGSGKTHIMRYYSYNASNLRAPKKGLAHLIDIKYFSIFFRASGLDSQRFDVVKDERQRSSLFSMYIELDFFAVVINTMIEIKKSSLDFFFNDKAFISFFCEKIGIELSGVDFRLEDLLLEVFRKRKAIDNALNDFPFTGTIDLKTISFFKLGEICFNLKDALVAWNKVFSEINILWCIDEIENFSSYQQIVVNTLLRYAEGRISFRLSGRLYSIKTRKTLGEAAEENRENSEFLLVNLDDFLRDFVGFKYFASEFIKNRMSYVQLNVRFDVENMFEDIDYSDFCRPAFDQLNIDEGLLLSNIKERFVRIFYPEEEVSGLDGFVLDIYNNLSKDMPVLLVMLNILRFLKKKKSLGASFLLKDAIAINKEALDFINGKDVDSVKNALSHYKFDLFAQACRLASLRIGVPYCGFDTLVEFSHSNPRVFSVLMGFIYKRVIYEGLNPFEKPISIQVQTQAVVEVAEYLYRQDSNHGGDVESVRRCVDRLAAILKSARYAVNIPESSPLAFSFANKKISRQSSDYIKKAVKYSFLIEIGRGRSDRNNELTNRKFYLSPSLSPLWRLPIYVRGDLSLTPDHINSIFSDDGNGFEMIARKLDSKWNFRPLSEGLFDGN